MVCTPTTTTGDIITELYNGNFFYILCPAETQLSQLGLYLLIFGGLALALMITYKSILPLVVLFLIGGSALIISNASIQSSFFSQIFYVMLLGSVAIGLFLVMRKLSEGR